MASITGAILLSRFTRNVVDMPMQLAKTMITANTEMARMRTAFTVMMGDSKLAEKHLDDLRKFGAATPFELPGLVKASQQLQQVGFSADAVIPMLTDFGNAASAGTLPMEEAVERIIRAVSQIKTAGKLMGGELMQLSNAGIPAKKIIAEELGMSMDQFADKMRKGGIAADVAVTALRKGLSKKFGERWVPDDAGGMKRLPSMMEQMSGQMEGLWSNFQDTLGQIALRGGNRLYTAMEGALRQVMDFVSSARGEAFVGGLINGITALTDALVAIAPAAGGFMAGFGGLAVAATGLSVGLGVLGTIFGFMGGPITVAALALGVFGAALSSAMSSAEFGPRIAAAWEMVSGVVSNIATRVMASFSMLSSAGGSFWETVQGFATSAFEAIAGFIAENQDTFVEWGAIIVQTVQGAIETIQAIWQAGVEFMQSVWQWFGGGTGTVWTWIKNLITGVLSEINITLHGWGSTWHLVTTQIAIWASEMWDAIKDLFFGGLAVLSGIGGSIVRFWEASWENIKRSCETAVDYIRATWAGLKAALAAPFKLSNPARVFRENFNQELDRLQADDKKFRDVGEAAASGFNEGMNAVFGMRDYGDSPITKQLRANRDAILKERDEIRRQLAAERAQVTTPAVPGPTPPKGPEAPTPGKKAEEEGGGAIGKAMKIALVGFADYSKKIQEAVTGGGTLALQRNILGEAKKTSAATENLGAKLDKTNEKLQALKDMQGGFK